MPVPAPPTRMPAVAVTVPPRTVVYPDAARRGNRPRDISDGVVSLEYYHGLVDRAHGSGRRCWVAIKIELALETAVS